MKKVISIVLALLMMIPMAAMLVPTASAATTADTSSGTAGKVYYEENFDDVDPTLVDKDLAAALGWNNPSSQATMWMENGKLRIFTQYTPSGVYPATANTWGGGYSAGTLVTDDNLIRNTTVFEYKFTYNRHAASTAEQNNDVTVTTKDGTTKTVKADGQGSYQTAVFHYAASTGAGKAAGTDNAIVRINQGGDGWANTMKGVDGAGEDKNAVYWKTTTFQKVNAMPAGETHVLEMQNNPVVTSESEAARTSNIMNREYSVKVIIEPWAHRLYCFVDGQLFITKDTNVNGTQYATNDWGRLITDSINFYVKPGVDVTIDDIKISDYVPGLSISEVMVNGTAANGTGKYQWIEITNPSAAPVNVYDYAIHLNTMPNYTNDNFTIGDEKDQSATSAWYVNAGSTLGYFAPGAKTLANGEEFNSPAYADGVLQPGESAIVLLPETAIKGGTSVTDEAFGAYLEGLGMPAGTKTFVADNESAYAFTLGNLTNESVFVQIVKATNTATDGGYAPVANCKGQSARFSNAFAECTAFVTSKGTGSGSAFFGMTVKNATNFPAETLGGNIGLNTDSSFEISYTGWVNSFATQLLDFDHTNLKWGFAKVKAGTARLNGAGQSVQATPGFVPVECRRATEIKVTDVDGVTTEKLVTVHTDVTVATPIVPGYDTRVLVNGEVVVAKATAETTTVAAKDLAAADIEIEVELYREGSGFVGYQTTAVDEDGYYDLRLLAAVNSFEDYKKLGFRVTFDDAGERSKTVEYEVAYVYTAVTEYTDGSEEIVTAEDYKSNYLYALHIKGVDSYLDLSVKVEVIYSLDGETWLTGTDNVDGFFEIVLD